MPANTRPPRKPADESAGYARASLTGRIIGKKIFPAGALPLHPAREGLSPPLDSPIKSVKG